MKGPSQRREHDAEEDDHRSERAPITGDEDELSLGAGKYRLTAKGGRVIVIVCVLAILGLVAYGIRENDRGRAEFKAEVNAEHRRMTATLSKDLRMAVCVLSMTTDERVAWRAMRGDPQQSLIAFCPGVLMATNGHALP